ncbi:Restriction system protein [Burkholderia diffusa]|uniref:restriction endonuclease n=1 Tax=Burkholderia diffusa TaxID=488732 RepID=UPI001CB0F14B|nr:restriction endonuclease [Burkholderia diffusa]CAG9265929.1 Restriction system protein [Burkholderia diffusa]
MNRISREMERSARASQRAHEQALRAQARAAREAEREERAYQRALIADEKENKRLYVESQLEDAASQNQEIEAQVEALGQILIEGLGSDPTLDFSKLRVKPTHKSVDLLGLPQSESPPVWERYAPEKPRGLAGVFPWVKKKHERQVLAARQRFEADERDYQAKEAIRQAEIKKRHDTHTRAVAQAERDANEHNQQVAQFEAAFRAADPDAIATYFIKVLERGAYPDGFAQTSLIEFQPESKQLVVAYDLPECDEIVPTIKSVKYVKASDSFTESARPDSQRRTIYADAVAQTTLRSLHEIFASDAAGHVETLVFNGYVDSIDRGTGKPIRPCIITVRTTREVFQDIDLAHVDPLTCLKSLNASVSKSAAELAPVRPVLELNMTDPRFIDEGDVLSTLDQRPNLMDLTPGEFESLITNLFHAMGLKSRQTQASRDGGVDCVAFDPRPIFGGKVVIQAKRYKNTVGVSAVRDLYGTMQNEGASKGILVATSGYGKAAFEFANGKPIELLAGSNLLYLLKEHANIDAKIVMPEDWVDIGPDA